jgi:hypothetical protein
LNQRGKFGNSSSTGSSCLKTLSYRKKISIAQIQKRYGKRIELKGILVYMDKNKNLRKKEVKSIFPTYMEIMDMIGSKVVKNRKKKFFLKEIPFDKVIENIKNSVKDFRHVLIHKN